MIDLDDAEHIRDLARRIAEARCERIRAASRLVSEVEAVIRPIRDRHLHELVDKVQARLSQRLCDRPEADAQ